MSATEHIDEVQRAIVDAGARVRALLEAHLEEKDAHQEVAAFEVPEESPLAHICQAFGLSPFERDVLLLCAGVELDSRIAALSARAAGDGARPEPTFALALAALPDPHWSALLPAAPLRYWRLVEVGAGDSLTRSPLRIDERILHFLTGIDYVDERLALIAEPIAYPGELTPSQRAVSDAVAHRLEQPFALIHLCGRDRLSRRSVAAAACAGSHRRLDMVRADAIPLDAAELVSVARLWAREAALSGAVLLLELDGADGDSARMSAAERLLAVLRAPVIMSGRVALPGVERPGVRIDVPMPSRSEQDTLWRRQLGPLAAELDGGLRRIVAQFDLGSQQISAAAAEVVAERPGDPDVAAERLWDACRAETRPALDDLAQRIEPAARWDDLVLPGPQREVLREIAANVRQRVQVYETWGFARKSSRGLGISALFSGMSGTGKTMAAEVLARDLRLDLYRIDLSSVVSKYIGETEKNLRRLFDAAEGTGVILLFDEADALFGKRTEVRDSHDRYANIEVSYLLQRMEGYRGLAILTTNLRTAIDAAFLRRIRFIVEFPFPDVDQREQIWRGVFPPEAQIGDLDMAQLARLGIPGGTIRNIGLRAAFLAADEDAPVEMEHVLRATRGEYAKLEQSLSEAELGGLR